MLSVKSHSVHLRNESELIDYLMHLGALPADFDADALVDYLHSQNAKLRFWVVKTLGKTENPKYASVLIRHIDSEFVSVVRREAVSAVGRMRDKRNVPALFRWLEDPDPKVVLQAIRGLLVFKGCPEIDRQLKKMQHHPNEMIQRVIQQAYVLPEKKERIKKKENLFWLRNVAVCGDVRDILKCVPDESIQLTFTSPPYYNARDYSIYKSYKAYLEFLTDVFQAVHRITEEGRFLVVNTSPIIIPRASRKHSSIRYPIPFDLNYYLQQIGWEFIDDIIWLKPEASVKNRNAGFLQHRKPLAYKPNPVTEYLMVYRKKTDKLIDWNIRQYDSKTVQESRVPDGYETSNVWRIDPVYDKHHSAVFPLELCRRVIQYYSFKGDIVFDPFAGSGTLGRAAVELERHFFLTEINTTYFDTIRQRTCGQVLFAGEVPRFYTFDEFKKVAYDACQNRC